VGVVAPCLALRLRSAPVQYNELATELLAGVEAGKHSTEKQRRHRTADRHAERKQEVVRVAEDRAARAADEAIGLRPRRSSLPMATDAIPTPTDERLGVLVILERAMHLLEQRELFVDARARRAALAATLNNLATFQIKVASQPRAALAHLQTALKLEEDACHDEEQPGTRRLAKSPTARIDELALFLHQSQESEAEQKQGVLDDDGSTMDVFKPSREAVCSTHVNLAAVLSSLGRHDAAHRHAAAAAEWLCSSLGIPIKPSLVNPTAPVVLSGNWDADVDGVSAIDRLLLHQGNVNRWQLLVQALFNKGAEEEHLRDSEAAARSYRAAQLVAHRWGAAMKEEVPVEVESAAELPAKLLVAVDEALTQARDASRKSRVAAARRETRRNARKGFVDTGLGRKTRSGKTLVGMVSQTPRGKRSRALHPSSALARGHVSPSFGGGEGAPTPLSTKSYASAHSHAPSRPSVPSLPSTGSLRSARGRIGGGAPREAWTGDSPRNSSLWARRKGGDGPRPALHALGDGSMSARLPMSPVLGAPKLPAMMHWGRSGSQERRLPQVAMPRRDHPSVPPWEPSHRPSLPRANQPSMFRLEDSRYSRGPIDPYGEAESVASSPRSKPDGPVSPDVTDAAVAPTYRDDDGEEHKAYVPRPPPVAAVAPDSPSRMRPYRETDARRLVMERTIPKISLGRISSFSDSSSRNNYSRSSSRGTPTSKVRMWGEEAPHFRDRPESSPEPEQTVESHQSTRSFKPPRPDSSPEPEQATDSRRRVAVSFKLPQSSDQVRVSSSHAQWRVVRPGEARPESSQSRGSHDRPNDRAYSKAVEMFVSGDTAPSRDMYTRSESDTIEEVEESEPLGLMEEAFHDDMKGHSELVASIRRSPSTPRGESPPPEEILPENESFTRKPSLLSKVKIREAPPPQPYDEDDDWVAEA
jgi:hypothetical protein